MTKKLYANSLDADETPINLGVSSGSKLFDTHTICFQNLSDNETLWKLKQTRIIEADNLLVFLGLMVKTNT